MTARDWAFLGCRLMALAHAVVAIMALPLTLTMVAANPSPVERDLLSKLLEVGPLIAIATKLIAAAFLFYGAGFLSNLLVRAPDAQTKPLPPKSVLAIGVFLVALFEALEYAPGLILSLQESAGRQGSGETTASIAANLVGLAAIAILLLWTWWSVRKQEAHP